MSSAIKRYAIPAAIAILAAFVWTLSPHSQPEHEGKPISYWFDRLPVMFPDPKTPQVLSFKDPKEIQALLAIRAMGTNALPFILREFEQNLDPFPLNSPTLKNSAQKVPLINNYLLTNAHTRVHRRLQAGAALLVMSPLPSEARAELARFSLLNTQETTTTFLGRSGFLVGIITNASFHDMFEQFLPPSTKPR